MGGGSGNSHTTVAKFQYMPGGQGGAGSARPTGGEASSISGRTASTTAYKALCCSQGFIAHLLSVAFCVEILRFGPCAGGSFPRNGPSTANMRTRAGQWTYRMAS